MDATCDTCGRDWPEDRFNRECSAPETCFRCRVAGLGTSFQGGKQFFHNDTIKGSVDRIKREFRARNGEDPIPKTSSGLGGFASVSQETKVRKALSGT